MIMIRSGELEPRKEFVSHTYIVRELLAIVCGDCVDRYLVRIQRMIEPTASTGFCSTRPKNLYLAARSTNETSAPLCP